MCAASHVRILPRMPDAVSAISYVNGLPHRLLCTSADGSIYVADFVRPEDSYTATVKLPGAASRIVFMSGDPFAICMCPGTTGPQRKEPRLVWYDMVRERVSVRVCVRVCVCMCVCVCV